MSSGLYNIKHGFDYVEDWIFRHTYTVEERIFEKYLLFNVGSALWLHAFTLKIYYYIIMF